jgi:hypothetical protein
VANLATDDVVVGTAIGTVEANERVGLQGHHLAVWPVAEATLQLQPRPVVQDRDVARLELEWNVDAIVG